MKRSNRLRAAALLALAAPGLAWAADGQLVDATKAQLQKRASGVMALMGYSQTPDVTSGALSIKNTSTGNPSFNNTSLGGGFTISDSVPLYMEGTLGWARYDPKFIASQGQESRVIPTKWNSAIATVGVGWDFRLAEHLVLRPIVNGSYGRVRSDVSIGSEVITNRTDINLDFLAHGHLDAAGMGGSLMLDYENYQPTHEIDVELRYTDIQLHSVNNSSRVVDGHARNQNASLWARWRAPIDDWHMLGRPFRYVLELAHTTYLGDETDVVGINHLTSVGAGVELDSSKYKPLWITRTRAVVRYVFGQNVHGVSLGIAVTFD
jgi:hypothetical protein